jgi:hypothetical protein
MHYFFRGNGNHGQGYATELMNTKSYLALILTLHPFLQSIAEPITVIAPQNLRIDYAEKSLDLTWDSVPDAIGYNIYTSDKPGLPRQKKLKVNSVLISSGPHFTYLWHFENKEKVRKIKGYRHFISVTAVFEKNGIRQESGQSEERDNRYFEGYTQAYTREAIEKILQPSQLAPLLPVPLDSQRVEDFIAFMTGPGKEFSAAIGKSIDFREVGACAPVSTALVDLMKNFGLPAVRIDGTFIREFHTFAIVKLGSVEYVLDFTADQFVPGVSPVFVPRDRCRLDSDGRLASEGTPVYEVSKIYSADQVGLADNNEAEIYKKIFNDITGRYKSLTPGKK